MTPNGPVPRLHPTVTLTDRQWDRVLRELAKSPSPTIAALHANIAGQVQEARRRHAELWAPSPEGCTCQRAWGNGYGGYIRPRWPDTCPVHGQQASK